MTANNTIIVTRHTGLIDWLQQRGITGDVIASATPDDVRGKHVIGALPLHLASLALDVTTVDYTCPFDLRGQDLSAQQLDALGAVLNTYTVAKV
ncbi:MAG: hypothetical protein J6W04_02250 [Bacteroidales bacterium]|nr:hypothetical protein [Bacteroidales bacterium]